MAISLTERAARKVRDIFQANDLPDDACVRLGVRGGGCAGFSYTLDVTDEPSGDDEVFTSQGVRVLCDPRSLPFLDGTTIDFDDTLLQGGFVFDNPNATRRCGCGASFATQ